MEQQLLQHLSKAKLIDIIQELQNGDKSTQSEAPYLPKITYEGDYVVRIMSRKELDFAVGLATLEGWNPGVYDADCFYAVDSNGFLIGLLNGEPISCISVVKYKSNYAFLGFYIVKQEYRGKGFGLKIWQEGMKYLEGYDVGLDGVIAQVPNYAKSGFNLAYYNTRYRGEALGGCGKSDSRIVDLSEVPFDDLYTYDKSLFPDERPEFLKLWINRPESINLGIKENGKLAGYTVLRKCQDGYKVGPLFADTPDLAEALFHALEVRVPRATPIFLDTPGEDQNPAATALAQRHKMVRVFKTARMYRMARPSTAMKLPLERWFGVTSFELG